MSDTAATIESQSKSKPANRGATLSVGFPFAQFEMPKFELPKETADVVAQWIGQAKDSCANGFSRFEEANRAFADMWSAVAKCGTGCSAKMTDMMRNNAMASLDAIHDAITAKTPSEMIDVSMADARKQYEAMITQTQELWTLAQQATARATTAMTAKPGASQASKAA
jgi:hypothetical protein